MEIQKYNTILNCDIECILVGSDVWFRGKDIAIALGYKDTDQAIRQHIEDEDKYKMEEISTLNFTGLTFNEQHTIYINESGLYSLILKSQKQEAKQFKQWITSEVLPSIRKTGTYSIIPPLPQILIQNETDLHYKVVQYIKIYFDNPIIVPGLGELQINTRQRDDAYNKGYKGGQPDILILNYHKK